MNFNLNINFTLFVAFCKKPQNPCSNIPIWNLQSIERQKAKAKRKNSSETDANNIEPSLTTTENFTIADEVDDGQVPTSNGRAKSRENARP